MKLRVAIQDRAQRLDSTAFASQPLREAAVARTQQRTVEHLVTEVLFIGQQRWRYLASGDQPTADNRHERRVRGNGGQCVRVLRVYGTENLKRDFSHALRSDSLKLRESRHLSGIESHRQSRVDPVTTARTGAKQHF